MSRGPTFTPHQADAQKCGRCFAGQGMHIPRCPECERIVPLHLTNGRRYYCPSCHEQQRGADRRCDLPAYLEALVPGEQTSNCRRCRQPIIWRHTPGGKSHPVDLEGGSHFASCRTRKRR